jgi:hypothetical protein
MEITEELVLVVAMVCVTVLGCAALFSGFDGQLFTAVIGAIVTIAGYLFVKAASGAKS